MLLQIRLFGREVLAVEVEAGGPAETGHAEFAGGSGGQFENAAPPVEDRFGFALQTCERPPPGAGEGLSTAPQGEEPPGTRYVRG